MLSISEAIMAIIVTIGGIGIISFVLFWIKEARGILSTEDKTCQGCLRETTQTRHKREIYTSASIRDIRCNIHIPYVETKCNDCKHTYVAKDDIPLLNTNKQKAIDLYTDMVNEIINREIIKE